MKSIISTTSAPSAIGPYSQAVKTGNVLYTSGQIAISPETGKLIEGGIREQTEQVMKNLQAVLKAAGKAFKDVIKTTVFLADMNDFTVMNEVYGAYFSEEPPARSTVQVARLPKDAKVEIELIATI